MNEATFIVRDDAGEPIEVGARVVYGFNAPGHRARVVAISEPDADYDDALGRGVLYPPKITLRFPDGEETEVSTYLAWSRVYADQDQFETDDVYVPKIETFRDAVLDFRFAFEEACYVVLRTLGIERLAHALHDGLVALGRRIGR